MITNQLKLEKVVERILKRRCTRSRTRKTIRTKNWRYIVRQRESDYPTYHISDKSQVYDEHVSTRVPIMGKPPARADEVAAVEPYASYINYYFLSSFKMACHSNTIHKVSAIFLVPHCMERTGAIALAVEMSLKPKSSKQMIEGELTTCSQVVNHLQQQCRHMSQTKTNAGADLDIWRLTQPRKCTPLQLLSTLCMKRLWVLQGDSRKLLKGKFIDGLLTSIRRTV